MNVGLPSVVPMIDYEKIDWFGFGDVMIGYEIQNRLSEKM